MLHENDVSSPSIYKACCPSRQILSRIGDKWSVVILSSLENDSIRFSELKKICDGISQKMLTQTLRNLQRDGLIQRYVVTLKPLHVEYALSDLGVNLLTLLNPLIDWVHRHCIQIEKSHREYDINV
ncbi:MAG: winged helix-turn-helix transcriptional regulator [Methylotenera sp.]